MLDQYAINTKNANGICKVNEIDWKHFWAVIENLGKGILVFQQRYTNGTRPTPTSDSRILYYVNSFIKYGIPKRKDTHARTKKLGKKEQSFTVENVQISSNTIDNKAQNWQLLYRK